MRNKKVFTTVLSLITAVVMMFCVSFAVLAADASVEEEVQPATEFQIPDVPEVSLVSGVVSWLCVAVGIAVLAGVLVSQRTKQVQKPDNRRR